MSTARLDLRRDDALGPDALAMMPESETELASNCPAEVRRAFSPARLRGAGVALVTAHLDGRAVGCGGVAPCRGNGELKRIFVTRAVRPAHRRRDSRGAGGRGPRVRPAPHAA